jgi:hypothetical protein
VSARASARLTRWIAAVLLTAAAVVLVLGLINSDDIAITPRSLAASVEREVGSADGQAGRCVRGRGPWVCTVPDRGGEGQVRYLVAVTDERCWSARLAGGVEPPGDRMPMRPSGCVEEQDDG